MAKKKIAIASQCGGSHTAFTAGALKQLLVSGVHEQYDLVGLTGTSAGFIKKLLRDGEIQAARFLEELGSAQPLS